MENCCVVPQKRESYCPTCGKKGKPVLAMTIKALIRKDWPDYDRIKDGYICKNPEDSTLYYIPGEDLTIDKKDVVVRVGFKEDEEPITVCYCFNYTKDEIHQDFFENSRSIIEDDIRQKVSSGVCSCEIKNPAGRCCLGEVRKEIKEIEQSTIKT